MASEVKKDDATNTSQSRATGCTVIDAVLDRAYYLRRYPDIANARVDPVKHYIEHGWREGRDPSPDFITDYYLKRYPDVAPSGLNPFFHYLTIGKPAGRGATPFSAGEPDFDTICEMLERPPKEVEEELVEGRRDLRHRLEKGILGEMVRRAGELEPLIHHSWLAAMQACFPPFRSEPVIAQMAAMYRLQNAAGWRRACAVIAIRSGGLSGATRLAGRLATALAEIYGPEEIVVLRTDHSEAALPDWFPNGCRQIDLAEAVQNMGENEREKLFVEYLRSLRPVAAFNINSRLFWETMRPYGKALSTSMSLYAYLLCNDMDIYGRWDGYPARQFYRHFDVYKAILVDSHSLAEDLREKFQIPPEQRHKLITLDTPVNNPLPLVPPPVSNQRPQIFWSGRFDRQKRLDVVATLATRLPEADFRLWGQPKLDQDFHKLAFPENITIEGLYENFGELPLDRCDLWLYTSQWDGVPNILLEVAPTGIPLVGSLAGGCGEVLIEGLCERVTNVEDIDAFEAAIRRVLADPAAARHRAKRLRQRVLAQRSPSTYRTMVEKLLAEKAFA